MFRQKRNSRSFGRGFGWFETRRDTPGLKTPDLVAVSPPLTSLTNKPPNKRLLGKIDPDKSTAPLQEWQKAFWPIKERPEATQSAATSPEGLSDLAKLALLKVPVTRTALCGAEERMLHQYLAEECRGSADRLFYFLWSFWHRDELSLLMDSTVRTRSQLEPSLDKMLHADHKTIYFLRRLVEPGLRCQKIVFQVSRKIDHQFFSALARNVPTGVLDPTLSCPIPIIGLAFGNSTHNYSILRLFLGDSSAEYDPAALVDEVTQNIAQTLQGLFHRAVTSMVYTTADNYSFDTIRP
ncbi:hypothetical protein METBISCDRAFT_28749 [Metschnikowia bicuspidata]|uniref:Uncharacterized protein n=1 Tax=Metschnikowia bicuspidata TaxID=27322 RepID=A0A4P9Z7Z7_9ASCO|nr:hypothetical protein METBISCDRAFT_28749 [Metschnikowia bicuspidata]